MNREGTYNLLGAYALDAVDAAEEGAGAREEAEREAPEIL